MPTNIECKVVVITGASSGLGEATARILSTNGASVVMGVPPRTPAIVCRCADEQRRQGDRVGDRGFESALQKAGAVIS
jgi:NAD(P)-dependent dehydrogenase (short-subunit alcohol dehydrogenase family)